MVSYLSFVLSLFVPRLSFFLVRGRTVFRDYGISWVSSLYFCFRILCEPNNHFVFLQHLNFGEDFTASTLYKSTADRYTDGPITARYRFIKNAYWVGTSKID